MWDLESLPPTRMIPSLSKKGDNDLIVLDALMKTPLLRCESSHENDCA